MGEWEEWEGVQGDVWKGDRGMWRGDGDVWRGDRRCVER